MLLLNALLMTALHGSPLNKEILADPPSESRRSSPRVVNAKKSTPLSSPSKKLPTQLESPHCKLTPVFAPPAIGMGEATMMDAHRLRPPLENAKEED